MASRKPVNRPSVKHPSHKHPLHIFKAQEEDEIICSGCELGLTGEAFKCTKTDCDYFLHKSCFDLPREINHKSHPNHPLTLLHSPPYESNAYGCDACGQYGSSFIYHCSKCQYDVHVGCAFLPEIVEREDHEHPLTLVFNSPCKGREGMVFMCDVCKETVSENLWVYHCKVCDYGTHVHSCAVYENDEVKRGGGEEEAVLEALRMESLRNARMELANMRISNKINNSVIHFGDEPRYHWNMYPMPFNSIIKQRIEDGDDYLKDYDEWS
ncbi:hypothetical protein YC2023_028751 [Brassica napus]